MSLSLKRSLGLAALFIGVAGGRAYAQDVISVKVPFDFQVKGRTFHAGRYELGLNPADGGVISLRGDHGKAFAFVSTIPAGGHDPEGDRPTLVFSRSENRYVLSQVWENGTQGREIGKG
jgi:hypothetical protein